MQMPINVTFIARILMSIMWLTPLACGQLGSRVYTEPYCDTVGSHNLTLLWADCPVQDQAVSIYNCDDYLHDPPEASMARMTLQVQCTNASHQAKSPQGFDEIKCSPAMKVYTTGTPTYHVSCQFAYWIE